MLALVAQLHACIRLVLIDKLFGEVANDEHLITGTKENRNLGCVGGKGEGQHYCQQK